MGIGEIFKRNGNSFVRDRCEKNPETGEVMCSRKRVFADKSEQDIAGFVMTADGSCNPTQTSSYENEEGALQELEKKFVPKIIGKCKARPEDF